jgi:hypothetical protein
MERTVKISKTLGLETSFLRATSDLEALKEFNAKYDGELSDADEAMTRYAALTTVAPRTSGHRRSWTRYRPARSVCGMARSATAFSPTLPSCPKRQQPRRTKPGSRPCCSIRGLCQRLSKLPVDRRPAHAPRQDNDGGQQTHAGWAE